MRFQFAQVKKKGSMSHSPNGNVFGHHLHTVRPKKKIRKNAITTFPYKLQKCSQSYNNSKKVPIFQKLLEYFISVRFLRIILVRASILDHPLLMSFSHCGNQLRKPSSATLKNATKITFQLNLQIRCLWTYNL